MSDTYLATIRALRRREISTHDVSQRVRLTKSPVQYLGARDARKEFPYEAMLASGRAEWSVGDRVRVYRTRAGEGAVVSQSDDGDSEDELRRDYDVEYYVRLLRDSFATRLARAFTPYDFSTVFADPDQPSLFSESLENVRTVLRKPGV